LKHKLFPKTSVKWKVLPVDYIANCIVNIAVKSSLRETVMSRKILYLNPVDSVRKAELFQYFREFGYEGNYVSTKIWVEKMDEIGELGSIYHIEENDEEAVCTISSVFPLLKLAGPELDRSYVFKMCEWLFWNGHVGSKPNKPE
jgi:hypothetical protein